MRNANSRLKEGCAETLFAFMQRGFGLLAPGDVRIGTPISKEVAVSVQDRHATSLQNHVPPVFCQVQIGESSKRLPSGKDLERCHLRLLTNLRGKQIVKMHSPHDFFGRVPQNLFHYRAGVEVKPICIHLPDELARALGDLPKSFLALPQGIPRPIPLGCVPKNTDQQPSSVRTGEVAGSDLDRDSMPVLVQDRALRQTRNLCILLKAASSRLRHLRGMQLGTMKRPQLREASATQSFCRGVRVHDHARVHVRQEYGVTYGVHDSSMLDHRILLSALHFFSFN